MLEGTRARARCADSRLGKLHFHSPIFHKVIT